MQNQNLHSWPWGQSSTPSPFPGGQPILSSGFPPAAADPTPLIPGYQIYGNPSVQQPDYAQWSSAQLQQWQQWQQWQEKYQQWQAQYGKKYEESLAAMSQSSNMILQGLPPVVGSSKLIKTPAPDPPLPVNSQPAPPPPPDEDKPPPPTTLAKDSSEGYKNGCQEIKDTFEELSEAEKTFDIQFKQWEGQFNAWKKENQDHPDKAQYREYEKKWESWREQLLQRREQMRKKRLNQGTEDNAGGAALSGKIEDEKKNSMEMGTGSTPAKSSDADYSYSSQPSSEIQSSFPGDGSKPPLLNEETAYSPNFSRRESEDVARNSFNSIQFFPGSGHFSGNQDKSEFNKPLMVSNSQIINRNQGPYGTQVGNFSGQMKGFPGSNGRFGNFEGAANEESFNQRSRNPGQGEGSVFDSGKSDNFSPRQKTGERLPGNFASSQRFHSEKIDKFRNGKNFGPQRYAEDYRDKEMGLYIFDKGKAEDADEFRQGGGNRQSENLNMQSSKPKVPSLFDITVEKPPGLKESGSERNPKIWEKNDREGYFVDSTDSKHKELEKNDNLRGLNVLRNKNAASPWMQPWELEKMNNQKLLEARNLERIMGKDNELWFKDVSQNQEMQKAELSGYVGNILAKLGHLNACPDNERGKFHRPGDRPLAGDSSSQFDFVGNIPKDCNQRVENESREIFPAFCGNSDPISRHPNRNFLQNDLESFRSRPEQNVKDSDSRFPNKVGDASGNSAASRNPNFDETVQFAAADIDERDLFRNQDLNSQSQDRIAEDGPHGGEDRTGFGRDDSRNFSRTFSRDDRRGFGNDDKFFTRDLSRVFARDDRAFGLGNPREDIDERFGRWGRRNFESREIRGFVERFGRGRERPLNEPVWNPQVFDYSQGRPLRLMDSEKGFKISTVVDYSHGENKQTFDYGHGDKSNDKMEVKSFDYGHSVEIPTVIDYGHGVKNDGDLKRDKSDSNFGDREKNTSSIHLAMRRSRSPKSQIRSRSRSPNSRHKAGSDSPSFKDKRLKGSGKNLMRRLRRNSDEKLSPGDDSVSKHSFDVTTVLVEDLICLPGRETRPNKLVFIMRGIPGSGKTYVTKLIKDKETEMGGDPPRILSLDDYFMTEVEKETIDEDTGRKIKTKRLEYEYEAAAEPHYRGSLVKAFKKTVSDGFFSFIIVDSVNEKTQDYEEMWSFAKQKGFQVYIAEMDNDVTVCTGRNIHKRTEKEISDLAAVWEETPSHYLRLDVRSLLQSDAITEVEMEVVSDSELEKSGMKEKQEEDKEKREEKEESQEEKEENEEEKEGKKDEDAADEDLEKKMDEEEDEPGVTIFVKSRWDQFENSEQNLDRLDGLKRRRGGFHTTMEDYLQLPDDLDEDVRDSVPGKKRVRWADLEERRQQEKMRAIGFVVGQTDWSRMTDPTFGESALTRTKYI